MFEWLERFWQDTKDFFLWLPRKLFEWLMQGLADLVNTIPVPDFVGDVAGYFGDLPAAISWGLWLFNVGLGLGMILTAYVLRFVIRRLPFVG